MTDKIQNALRKIAQDESWYDKLLTPGRWLGDKIGTGWGWLDTNFLNNPLNKGRTGPNQYFDLIQAAANKDAWKSAAVRAGSHPGGAMEYFSDPNNADDAMSLYTALDNRAARTKIKQDQVVDRYRAISAAKDEWKRANPGKQITREIEDSIASKYKQLYSEDYDAVHRQLGLMINHATKAKGGFRKNFSTTMRMLNDAKNAGNYLLPRDGTGEILVRENVGDYFSDEAKKHIDAMHRLASDDARMSMLKDIDKNAYDNLNKYKSRIAFASRNHGALKSLWSLKTNPLMWIVRALLFGDRNAFAAIRGINDIITNRNSEWYKAANDTLADLGVGEGDREKAYSAFRKKVNPYLPWARLLHNVRGVLGGSKDFKPIIYRGR